MAPGGEAPKRSKNRKLGKGKKKAWGVANTKDLEEFLDEERRQLETGGIVSEKSDEKLFFVDKAKSKKIVPSGKPVSKEDRRCRSLRSTALLTPNDGISSVIRRPPEENYKKGKRSQKVVSRKLERAASKMRLIAVEQRKKFVQEKWTAKRKRNDPSLVDDIWDGDETEATAVKRPKTLMNKPSKLSATIVPHSGASVNPSFKDHQDLLQKALDVELKKKMACLQTSRVLKPLGTEKVATEETFLAEMSAGLLPDTDSENEKEDPTEPEVTRSVKLPNRKTKRQRQTEIKLKEQLRKKAAKTEQNKRENMVFRLRNIKTEIRKQDEKMKDKLEAKQKLQEQAPYKTKRLGKTRFEEPCAEFKLSKELVASLRQVKPEGSVLGDVHKSMMRRNILEPRVKQKRKPRYKSKTFVKKSHREIG